MADIKQTAEAVSPKADVPAPALDAWADDVLARIAALEQAVFGAAST